MIARALVYCLNLMEIRLTPYLFPRNDYDTFQNAIHCLHLGIHKLQ